MSFIEIMDIVLVALCVLAYAVQIYLKVKCNVLEAVSELIALAESTGLAGSEKMAQVVERLYEKVPALLKKVLTKDDLQKIAQRIFEWMRRYAVTYANIASESHSEEERKEELKEAATALTIEASAEMISGLFGLTLAALKEKAKEYGIEIDQEAQKKEVAQAIIIALLNKGVTQP